MQKSPSAPLEVAASEGASVSAVPASQRKIMRDGSVLSVRHVYDRAPHDPDVAEELAEIEDLEIADKSRAMCSLMHRLALDQSCDRYEDPMTGFEVFTSEALRKQQCCGEVCRHCPHGHVNVPKRRLAAAAAEQKRALLDSTQSHSASRVDHNVSHGCPSQGTSPSSEVLSPADHVEAGMEGSSSSSSDLSGQSESSRSGNSQSESESGCTSGEEEDDADDEQDADRSFEPLTEADLSPEAQREAESEGARRFLGYESVMHREACRAGRPAYIDPSTGAYVFTAAQLEARPCCGNGCRHCPHDHCCVPEYMRAAKREIALLDESWDW